MKERIGHYQKDVITVAADASVARVAHRMREEGVGCVVVVAEDGHPMGIVTDRDLLLRVIAVNRDPDDTTASAVMSHPLVEATPNDPIERVIDVMRSHGVRRVPVIREKRVVGLVALDDLLVALAAELSDLSEAVLREIRGGRRRGRTDQVRRRLGEQVDGWIAGVERLSDRVHENFGEGLGRLRRGFERLLL